MPDRNSTVYSTEYGRICPKCNKPVAECICKTKEHPRGDGIIRVQRESKGRKGKTVTLVTGIDLNHEAIRSLLSELKRLCGSGGTLKDGILEIQGDHRDKVFVELLKRGYAVKKAGG